MPAGVVPTMVVWLSLQTRSVGCPVGLSNEWDQVTNGGRFYARDGAVMQQQGPEIDRGKGIRFFVQPVDNCPVSSPEMALVVAEALNAAPASYLSHMGRERATKDWIGTRVLYRSDGGETADVGTVVDIGVVTNLVMVRFDSDPGNPKACYPRTLSAIVVRDGSGAGVVARDKPSPEVTEASS